MGGNNSSNNSIKFFPNSLSEEFTLVLAQSQCAIVLGWPRGQFGNWKWHNWICKTWSEVLIKGARAARPISQPGQGGTRHSEHWNLATGGSTQTGSNIFSRQETNPHSFLTESGKVHFILSRQPSFGLILLKLMNDAKSSKYSPCPIMGWLAERPKV